MCRKKLGFDWREVDAVIERLLAGLKVVPVTVDTHELGRRVAERYQISFHDAALLASAIIDGCDTSWSRDLHDGLIVSGSLTIRNPFS